MPDWMIEARMSGTSGSLVGSNVSMMPPSIGTFGGHFMALAVARRGSGARLGLRLWLCRSLRLGSRPLHLVVGKMQLMHHAMKHRREDEAGDADQEQPGIERVDAFEDLAALMLGLAIRPHAAEDHGRVAERFAPVEALEMVIADHADEQRPEHHDDRDADIPGEPAGEQPARRKRLPTVLEHREDAETAVRLGLAVVHAPLLTRGPAVWRLPLRRMDGGGTTLPKSAPTPPHLRSFHARERLSDRSVPARWHQHAQRSIWRQYRESDALPARGSRCGDRRGRRRAHRI